MRRHHGPVGTIGTVQPDFTRPVSIGDIDQGGLLGGPSWHHFVALRGDYRADARALQIDRDDIVIPVVSVKTSACPSGDTAGHSRTVLAARQRMAVSRHRVGDP